MSLEERTYSILVVSAGESFNSNFEKLTAGSRYGPIKYISNISSAKREFSERPFDFVIINSPLPDDPGIRFAKDVCSDSGSACMIIVRTQLRDETAASVSPFGVFTLGKPVSGTILETALGWMAAVTERLRLAQKKTLSIEEKMEEIRLVNRAKWLLIAELKMDEPSAHRYIEKQAMDRCITRREVAEDIIDIYS